MAAVRAGVGRVHVPAALRDVLLPELAGSPTARAAVSWLYAETPALLDTALLVPITAPPPPSTLARAAEAEPPAVVLESTGRGAPVALASAPLLAAVWTALTTGAPVGARLDALLSATAPEFVRGDAGVRLSGVTDVRTAEDRLYAGLGSAIDTPLDTHVHRRLSRRVSRLTVAAGITPNQVSVASLVVGLVAAGCFAVATPPGVFAGLLAYLAAVVLDHTDGEVARLTLTESTLGARLDVVVDTVVHASVVIALGIAATTLRGHGTGLGLLAAVGVVMSAAAACRWPLAAAEDRVGAVLSALGTRDGFYVMLLAFLVGITWAPAALPTLMVIVAAGSHAYWVGRVVYRLVRGAA
jgi:phosphatidylglycerophosphate synthase